MPLNIDWKQILLHLFNFVVLFAVLYFLLYKPVKDFMEKRIRHYQDIEQQVEARLAAAAQTQDAYEKHMADLDQELAERRQKARLETDHAVAARLQRAEEEADHIIAEAREHIKQERAIMMKKANKEITRMVIDTAEKLVSHSSTSDAFDQFLDAAKRGEADE